MHEASLAQGLLNLITDSVCQYNAAHPEKPAGRVTSLRLGLGPLSCVETETFKGCFELLSEGSVAEGAKLDMEIIPVSCTCVSCGEHFLLRKKNVPLSSVRERSAFLHRRTRTHSPEPGSRK